MCQNRIVLKEPHTMHICMHMTVHVSHHINKAPSSPHPVGMIIWNHYNPAALNVNDHVLMCRTLNKTDTSPAHLYCSWGINACALHNCDCVQSCQVLWILLQAHDLLDPTVMRKKDPCLRGCPTVYRSRGVLEVTRWLLRLMQPDMLENECCRCIATHQPVLDSSMQLCEVVYLAQQLDDYYASVLHIVRALLLRVQITACFSS